jgi:hypothetical protein
MRTVYRKKTRNGETVDPVSVRVGVVGDGWLPRTARAMAHLLAKEPSREAEETARELARLPYSRSSFERVGHDVGGLYRRAQPRIEQVLIEEFAVPTEALQPKRDALSPSRRTPAARRSTVATAQRRRGLPSGLLGS